MIIHIQYNYQMANCSNVTDQSGEFCLARSQFSIYCSFVDLFIFFQIRIRRKDIITGSCNQAQ